MLTVKVIDMMMRTYITHFHIRPVYSLTLIICCRKEPVHIPALQTLLLARSPVFAAMFTGDLAEKTNKPVIHIDDVEPQSFKEMLR